MVGNVAENSTTGSIVSKKRETWAQNGLLNPKALFKLHISFKKFKCSNASQAVPFSDD